MSLYLVSVSVRLYHNDSFFNSFTMRVQVIASSQLDAENIGFSVIKSEYDKREGNWSCVLIGSQLLYNNYKIVD